MYVYVHEHRRCVATEEQCAALTNKCAELKRKLDESQSALLDIAAEHQQLQVCYLALSFATSIFVTTYRNQILIKMQTVISTFTSLQYIH